MTCEDVGGAIIRCENKEVVCYTGDSGSSWQYSMHPSSGINCTAKQTQNKN
jgi:hypothetical protein